MAITEMASNPPHPLENLLILDKLFEFFDTKNLKTCRTVNRTWSYAISKTRQKRQDSCTVKLNDANISDHLTFLEERFDICWSCKYTLNLDLSSAFVAQQTIEMVQKISEYWEDKKCFEALHVTWPQDNDISEQIMASFAAVMNNLHLKDLTLHFKSLVLPHHTLIHPCATGIARIVNSLPEQMKLTISFGTWVGDSNPFNGIECKVLSEAFKQVQIWSSVEELEFPMDMSESFHPVLTQIQLPKLRHLKIKFPAGITDHNSRLLQQFVSHNCPSLCLLCLDFENPVFLIDFRLTSKDERFLKALPKGVKLLSDSSNKISMIESWLDFF